MPLVTANQFDLVPQFSNIGTGFAQGAQIGSQFRQKRLQDEALEADQAKQAQISQFSQAALGGDKAALGSLAGVDPQRANQLQTFLTSMSEAERTEMLRENENMTRGALNILKISGNDPAKARVALQNQVKEWKAQGLDTTRSEGAIALDDGAMMQALQEQGSMGLEIDQFAKNVLTPDSSKQRQLDIQERTLSQRQTEQEFQERQAEAKAGELSPTVQKILDSSQTSAIDAGNRSRSLSVLADDIAKIDIGGGAASSTSEMLKTLLGSQDEVSNLRMRFRAVRSSQAVQNLPPGAASDKDIELALSGFPSENANAEQVSSFLRGAAKLEGINAAFETFKSDLISNTKSTKGLLSKWNDTVESEALGRKIRTSELFITAQEEGITVEELKQQLGIK